MRFHDWPERLRLYILAREQRVFEWGRRAHDCCAFAAAGVLAIRADGLDLMEGIPDYASADEADLVIGDEGLARFADARLPRRASIGLAQRGDLVLLEHRETEIFGLVEGVSIVAPGTRNLFRLPRAAIVAAWEV